MELILAIVLAVIGIAVVVVFGLAAVVMLSVIIDGPKDLEYFSDDDW